MTLAPSRETPGLHMIGYTTQSVKQQAIMFMNLVLSFAGVWAFTYYALHATLQTQGMV